MGVMCGEKGENFMILFWEKEREEEERRRREGEDRIKSAMGIKSFCHDISFELPLSFEQAAAYRKANGQYVRKNQWRETNVTVYIDLD